MKYRHVITTMIVMLPVALAPHTSAGSVDAVLTPGEAAAKTGTASWFTNGVIFNADGGQGSQSSSIGGPYGDRTCTCADYRWGVCQSWEAHGRFEVRWHPGRWRGTSSELTFWGEASETYRYKANSGWQTPCNTQLTASYEAALFTARVASNGFHTLPRGPAGGWSGVGVSAPFVPDVAVPLRVMHTSGTGQWFGNDLSWSFAYRGSGSVTGTEFCSSCVTASGRSLA